MIIRARCVLTMDGAPIDEGAVVVCGEKIADVGTWSDIRAQHAGEVLDLGESILLPGLINAHCHLDYTNMRGVIPPPGSFAEWIRAINAQKANWNDNDYVRSISAGLDEAARFGTTTIVNLEAFPALIAKVNSLSMKLLWFAEMIDVRGAITPPAKINLAPHAPYTASADLYRATARIAHEQSLLATTHIAESREEMEMFRDAAGPLFGFMQAIGRPMNDCGSRTPLSVVVKYEALDERWIVAHMNELTNEDFALLGDAPKFHIVHCPRSHAYFGHSRFQYAKLRDLGFNICLGTDSLASNDDLSLFAEMRQFARNYPDVSPREILELVTTRAAAALHESHSLGRIRRGFLADLIAIPCADSRHDKFENVLEFDRDVAWRMLNGDVALPR